MSTAMPVAASSPAPGYALAQNDPDTVDAPRGSIEFRIRKLVGFADT